MLLLGVLGTLGGVHLVEYSESAAFCTTCHTMTPQKKAYEAGVHQDVGCGECHVNPGVVGFVKAKLAGTRELYALVTSTYPTPIPPIPHDELPPTKNTCQKCHPLSQLADPGQPSKLHVRASFERDEPNTRHDLAVLIRPANADSGDPVSVHWHVLQDVTYTSSDEHQQTIDSVQFKDSKTGELEQYIAEGQVRESVNAGADLARLTATETTRTMDCLACHNRVGHDSPTADRAVDAAMADGSISPRPALRQAQRRHPPHEQVRHRRGGPGRHQQAVRVLRDEVPAGREEPGERDRRGDPRAHGDLRPDRHLAHEHPQRHLPQQPGPPEPPPAASGATTAPTTRSSRDG